MSKKIFLIIGILLLIGIIAIICLRILTPEDTWLCNNGEWIKHGNPSAEKPSGGCGTQDTTIKNDKIEVTTPIKNSTVSSPLTIAGRARGNWFFEGSFPIKLLDESGNLLAQTVATAQGEWMTNDWVTFTASLKFNSGSATKGKLILMKDNPSGLPVNDEQIEIPVNFSEVDKMTVRVYFGKYESSDCAKVYPVDREVEKTVATARVALDELLKGPTAEEKAMGYFTLINSGVKINKITIENGVAKVDFDKRIEEAMGGSCRVTGIRAQITETLKQFPTVKSVIISVDGRIEDILQP